jgi:DNA-binding NarL/FixJ family response regulator
MSVLTRGYGAVVDELGERCISVLIADDHPLIISGIRRTIDDVEDIDVIGEATTAPQLLALIERRRPSIVLMDMGMPGSDGVERIGYIRATWPEVKVIILSASDEPRQIEAALRAGASAYVVKTAVAADIEAVLRQVAGGAVFLAPPPVPRNLPGGAEVPVTPKLTERERAILAAVVTGMTTAEIARHLWISEHTIKFHLTNIYRKLGVGNRAGAVRHALEAGLVG